MSKGPVAASPSHKREYVREDYCSKPRPAALECGTRRSDKNQSYRSWIDFTGGWFFNHNRAPTRRPERDCVRRTRRSSASMSARTTRSQLPLRVWMRFLVSEKNQSGRGLPHSKTLARFLDAPEGAKRFGVR